MDRSVLLSHYPWLAPHDQPERVVIGDDLDSALTAALYLHQHPNAKLVGLYSQYTTVFHSVDISANDLLKAVWLDLDIYHRKCRSLGHHIVRHSLADQLTGFASSCNLNELTGRLVERDFWRKYPLGTIHFLMWLYGLEIPVGCDALIWLADSAYINGQTTSYKFYRDAETGTLKFVPRQGFFQNVEAWLRDELPLPSLLETFADIDEENFEWQMTYIMRDLSAAGFKRGMGQVASRHLQLHGFQCQPQNDDVIGHMLRLIAFVSQRTGWTVGPEQTDGLHRVNSRVAHRATAELSLIQQTGGLDQFLEHHKVFSYVFPNKHAINYTSVISS